jgi:hypothetical protein
MRANINLSELNNSLETGAVFDCDRVQGQTQVDGQVDVGRVGSRCELVGSRSLLADHQLVGLIQSRNGQADLDPAVVGTRLERDGDGGSALRFDQQSGGRDEEAQRPAAAIVDRLAEPQVEADLSSSRRREEAGHPQFRRLAGRNDGFQEFWSKGNEFSYERLLLIT